WARRVVSGSASMVCSAPAGGGDLARDAAGGGAGVVGQVELEAVHQLDALPPPTGPRLPRDGGSAERLRRVGLAARLRGRVGGSARGLRRYAGQLAQPLRARP